LARRGQSAIIPALGSLNPIVYYGINVMSNHPISSPDSAHPSSFRAWLKQHRARLFLGLRLLVAFSLMAFVIGLVARDSDKLKDIDWRLVPVAFVLTIISMVIKAFRWSLLTRQSRMNISFTRLFGTYMVGAFFNTILPSNVGGDAVRAVDTAAMSGRVADATSSVLIERGMGMMAIVTAGSICTLFLKPGTVPILFLLAVNAMFITGIIGIVILRQGWFMEPIVRLLRRFNLGRFADKAANLQIAFSGHLGRPGILLSMFVLSVIANALTMSSVYLVLIAVTDPVPVLAFVPMIALCTTAEMIPLSPASLGVKESAYVFFLGLIGVANVAAGVIALIVRVMDWTRALLGGIVFLSRTLRTEREKRKPPDQRPPSDGHHGEGPARPDSSPDGPPVDALYPGDMVPEESVGIPSAN
jgi:uncharacterized protein (TIRG00374 family)